MWNSEKDHVNDETVDEGLFKDKKENENPIVGQMDDFETDM